MGCAAIRGAVFFLLYRCCGVPTGPQYASKERETGFTRTPTTNSTSCPAHHLECRLCTTGKRETKERRTRTDNQETPQDSRRTRTSAQRASARSDKQEPPDVTGKPRAQTRGTGVCRECRMTPGGVTPAQHRTGAHKPMIRKDRDDTRQRGDEPVQEPPDVTGNPRAQARGTGVCRNCRMTPGGETPAQHRTSAHRPTGRKIRDDTRQRGDELTPPHTELLHWGHTCLRTVVPHTPVARGTNEKCYSEPLTTIADGSSPLTCIGPERLPRPCIRKVQACLTGGVRAQLERTYRHAGTDTTHPPRKWGTRANTTHPNYHPRDVGKNTYTAKRGLNTKKPIQHQSTRLKKRYTPGTNAGIARATAQQKAQNALVKTQPSRDRSFYRVEKEPGESVPTPLTDPPIPTQKNHTLQSEPYDCNPDNRDTNRNRTKLDPTTQPNTNSTHVARNGGTHERATPHQTSTPPPTATRHTYTIQGDLRMRIAADAGTYTDRKSQGSTHELHTADVGAAGAQEKYIKNGKHRREGGTEERYRRHTLSHRRIMNTGGRATATPNKTCTAPHNQNETKGATQTQQHCNQTVQTPHTPPGSGATAINPSNQKYDLRGEAARAPTQSTNPGNAYKVRKNCREGDERGYRDTPNAGGDGFTISSALVRVCPRSDESARVRNEGNGGRRSRRPRHQGRAPKGGATQVRKSNRRKRGGRPATWRANQLPVARAAVSAWIP